MVKMRSDSLLHSCMIFAALIQASAAQSFLNSSTIGSNSSSYATSQSSSISGTGSVNVGSFILQGLGSIATNNATNPATTTYTGPETYVSPLTGYGITALGKESYTTTDNITSLAVLQSSALSCWSAYATWRNQSTSWYNANVAGKSWPLTTTTSIYINTYHITSVIFPTGSVSTYKLCDGSPRASISPSTITTLITSTDTVVYSNVAATPSWSVPNPCTTTDPICKLLELDTNILSIDNSSSSGQDAAALYALCGLPAHSGGGCVLAAAGNIKLYYFPETLSNNTQCPNNRSTITNTATTPIAITSNGQVFSRNKAYISVDTVYAFEDGYFNITIGPVLTNLIITLESSQVSTQCGGNGINTIMDFGDLQYPVPASAYSCGVQCARLKPFVDPAKCSTIWNNFNPALAVPQDQLWSLVPEWSTANCVSQDQGLQPFPYFFDPPKALTAESTAAGVSTPSTQAAAPSSTPASPLPVNTGSATAADPSSSNQASNPAASSQPSAQGSSTPQQASSANPPGSTPQQSSNQASNVGASSNSGKQVSTSVQQTSAGAVVLSILSAALTGASGQSGQSATSIAPVSTQTGAVLSLGSSTVTAVQSGANVVIGSQTLAVGQGTTISGVVVSAASNAVVVGSTTVAVSALPTSSQNQADPAQSTKVALSVVSASGLTLTPLAASGNTNAVVLGSSTLVAGGAAITSNGQVISLGSSGLVISGSQTQVVVPVSAAIAANSQALAKTAVFAFEPIASSPSTVLAAGSLTVTAAPVSGSPGAVVIGGSTTLSVGGAVQTVNGQTISLASSGLILINAQTTAKLSAVSASATSGQVLAFGSLTFTAASISGKTGIFSVAGTTLSAGGSALVISGQTISAAPTGLVDISSGHTVALSTVAQAGDPTSSSQVTTTTATSVRAPSASPSSTSSRSGAGFVNARGWMELWATLVVASLGIVLYI